MRKLNEIGLNFLVIFILLLISFKQISSDNYTEEHSYCLQNRTNEKVFEKDCSEITKDFCSNIQCEPIDDCVGPNKEIVKDVTARKCCPACVEYLDEDDNCEVGAILKRCRNGLSCDPSTKQCNIPRIKNKCLIEYHNRRHVQKNKIPLWVASNPSISTPPPTYFPIYYANDIEFPTCDAETGKYDLKQCRKSKCYCVNPEDGKYTFGLTEDFIAENVTCECADHFYKKLMLGNVNGEKIDLDAQNMEHFASIHSKCDTSGNYQPLQCINSTCFCVDEKTGMPLPEKAAIYGALSALSCFDEEKSKKLKTKEADANYQSTCEKLLLKTRSISLHFLKKGVKLRGLDSITCQFNGEFAPKQCLPGQCNCVSPEGSQLGSYAVDRQGGKDSLMECRCAQEEYYAEHDKLAFNKLQCDGSGNFNAFQSFDNGMETYCVDEDGSRISESKPVKCLDKFKKAKDPFLLNDGICRAMRRILTDEVMDPDKYYIYNRTIDFYEAKSEIIKDIFCESDCQDGCPK